MLIGRLRHIGTFYGHDPTLWDATGTAKMSAPCLTLTKPDEIAQRNVTSGAYTSAHLRSIMTPNPRGNAQNANTAIYV
jgi:hypothetical protein